VVACQEQNNNPPDVKWRQVGEIEGGEFPQTRRFYLSMSCNHCQDPSCLNGCPVDAYYKDEKTGIVLMKDNACIGCQYCTWNCPYGAPQYNPERRMVTKCDMCHGRIAEGRNPACVEVCPSQALTIERFNVEEWKGDLSQANAPGVPDASLTQSTTRITFSQKEEIDFGRTDGYRIQPEKPHYSLILLTVLTQLAVGGFGCLFVLESLNHFLHLSPFFGKFLRLGHLAMAATALVALNASVFHLGRPLYAIRAVKMWRRSWLSREVLFFTLFVGSVLFYSLGGYQEICPVPLWARGVLGIATLLFGLGGVFCSAMIYRVPARPSWDTWQTPVAFFATAFLLGPLLSVVVFAWSLQGQLTPWVEALPTIKIVGVFLTSTLLAAGFVQLAGILVKLLSLLSEDELELRSSARLLTQRFRGLFLSRLGLLLMTLLLIPWILSTLVSNPDVQVPLLASSLTFLMLLALLSEMVGRYLFFVTVVPKKRPEGYF
jgi:Fe-S-cluster-containing dehydrogenase component/DMSO reductase anchor subunit